MIIALLFYHFQNASVEDMAVDDDAQVGTTFFSSALFTLGINVNVFLLTFENGLNAVPCYSFVHA